MKIGKQGTRYTLDGAPVEPKDFFGVGGFKFSNHIFAWIMGGARNMGGGVHLSNAKRYIEREVLGLGCRRMRAPMELMLWTGPYFDASRDAPEPWRGWANVANTLELVNIRTATGSGMSLTPGMEKLIRMYVVLAREFDIVIEVPVLWTIKSTASGEALERLGLPNDPRERFRVDVWNEHFIAAHGVGAYVRQLREEGDGDGEHRVDPGGLNLMFDLMNEYTAHVPRVWDDGALRNVARRWKTRDAGELALISESGSADRYGPPLASQHGDQGFDAVVSHPPRDGEWAKTGDVLRATWPGELIDVNESQMGWTSGQRSKWVGLIPKWAGLGSTDMPTWAQMHQNFIDHGIYTTFHTLRAMDAGWPDTPQTVVEDTIREITGARPGDDRPPPAPPTDPIPTDPPPSGGAVAYVSGPDEDGVRYIQIEFPGWPRVVAGDEEADAVLEEHVLELPEAWTFYGAGSFIGLDRGDVGEFDVRIAADGGPMIYQRSLHKETAAPFDSEDWKYANLVTCKRLRIWLGARTTGANDILRRGEPWTSRPHFGGRLWTYREE